MTDREVMQMALECLESLQGGCTDSADGTVEALTVWCPEVVEALRARLAAPEPEPVAWRVMLPDGYQFVYDERMLRVIDESIHATRQPLYTTPPTRRPLKDEEIINAVHDADLDWAKGWTLDETHGNRFATLARAIEAAHGIKEPE